MISRRRVSALRQRKGDGGRGITSFAIVTADAASSTKQYHDRTPVVLEDSQFDEWMRGAPDQAAALMKRTSGHS
jgi:putative SOS response-associated peptidase YedK